MSVNQQDRCLQLSLTTLKMKNAKSRLTERLFATPRIIQSMESSRPEYWSGKPFPSAGDLTNPAIKPRSLALQVDSLSTELSGKSLFKIIVLNIQE